MASIVMPRLLPQLPARAHWVVPSSIHPSSSCRSWPAAACKPLQLGAAVTHDTHLITDGFAAVLMEIALSCPQCPHLKLLSMQPQAMQHVAVVLQGQAAIRLQQGRMLSVTVSSSLTRQGDSQSSLRSSSWR